MKKKVSLFLVILLFKCSLINKNTEDSNEGLLLLNILLVQTVISLSEKNIFYNHNYSFSVKRDKIIGGETFKQCIDILKLNTVDPSRVLTKYDDLERTPRCGTNEIRNVRCIATATIYVDIQFFINLSSEKLNSSLGIINTDCKNIENGILAY